MLQSLLGKVKETLILVIIPASFVGPRQAVGLEQRRT